MHRTWTGGDRHRRSVVCVRACVRVCVRACVTACSVRARAHARTRACGLGRPPSGSRRTQALART